MTVDPKVHALAESFVRDLFTETPPKWAYDEQYPIKRAELVQRAAEAMQRAIEDECEAIRQELTA